MMKRNVIFCAAAAALVALAAVSCQPKVSSSSNTDAFLKQKDVCMVAGQKEYIGGAGNLVQCSFNPTKHLFRGGNIVEKFDTTAKVTVETVEDYFVLIAAGMPGDVGSTLDAFVYLKHRTLPNSFRTYGTKEKPVAFDVLRKENGLVWLWAPAIKIGVVIRTEAQGNGN